jgi:predicted ATPase
MRRLFQVAAAGLPAEFPSLRSMESYVTTLPAQRTTLIGRNELIGEIRRLLLDHRLVSLLGPGGVGKTRVAIEAAGRELGTFGGGVFFVDLTNTATESDVIAAIVSGVRAPLEHDRPAVRSLAAHLAGRPALLVVDNCEHVVDQAAGGLGGPSHLVP